MLSPFQTLILHTAELQIWVLICHVSRIWVSLQRVFGMPRKVFWWACQVLLDCQLQGHYPQLFLWNGRIVFPVPMKGGFGYWLMSSEMAFSYYRIKILIWGPLSEKKGPLYYVTSRFHWLVDLSEVGSVGKIKKLCLSSNAKWSCWDERRLLSS